MRTLRCARNRCQSYVLLSRRVTAYVLSIIVSAHNWMRSTTQHTNRSIYVLKSHVHMCTFHMQILLSHTYRTARHHLQDRDGQVAAQKAPEHTHTHTLQRLLVMTRSRSHFLRRKCYGRWWPPHQGECFWGAKPIALIANRSAPSSSSAVGAHTILGSVCVCVISSVPQFTRILFTASARDVI